MLAWNEALEETGYYTVTAVWSHEDPVIVHLTIDGELIETTPDHPFLTADGEWVAAGELTAGTAVVNADGDVGTVDAIAFVVDAQVMFNMTVAEAHTYVVGDGEWVVHNACFAHSLTGYQGRLETVAGYVTPQDIGTGRGTNSTARRVARALGNTNDDAGHAIGKNLGGLLEDNIFPQTLGINRGKFRVFEGQIADMVSTTGHSANLTVQFMYESSTSTRPIGIVYSVEIDGNLYQRIFDNP